MAGNELCVLLEEKGCLASPIHGCYPWKITGREFRGLLPLVFWAAQAGLGKLTKCGLLAHPAYGTRILLAGVVTSASLKPAEQIAGQACPEDCRKCVEACPANAIDQTGKINHNACIRHSGANPLLALVLRDAALKDKFSFETIVNTVGQES
jgi:epoxyqueuosine reductase